MQVKTSHVGALGADSVQALTPTTAKALKDSGISFSIRYLGSVSPAELSIILDAGLAFMPVTFSRAPGWLPSASLGASDGVAAIAHLKALGLPPGATVWLDLEGPGGTSTDVVAWVNAWADYVKNAGYDPGLYVGYGAKLTSHELYALHVDRYWHSVSKVTDTGGNIAEPNCGWCMHQLNPSVMWAGVWADIDVVQQDYQGRTPTWVTG